MSQVTLAISILLGLACLAWWAMALLIHRNLRAALRLDRIRPPEPAVWPSLGIVVPARDEAATLGAAMRTRLQDDYPRLSVLLVNDRSTDATAEVAERLAARDERLAVLHIAELAEGWLGKVHAMQRGVEQMDSEWVLLTDADVHLAPGSLRRAVAWCEAEGVDFLAALPRMRSVGLALDSVLVVFLQLLVLGMRAREVRDPKSSVGIGSGSFTLVRRSLLLDRGLLERVRLEVADDLALGLAAKVAGARCAAMLAGGAVEVTFYPSLGAMFRGSEKNGFAVLGRYSLLRTWLASFAFLGVQWAPLLALGVVWEPWIQVMGALTIILAVVQLGGLARSNGWSPLTALCWPLGALLFTAMMLRSGWRGWRQGGLYWRGTFYPTELLRQGSRDAMGELLGWGG